MEHPGGERRRLAGLARGLRSWLVLILVCAGFSCHPDFRERFWNLDYLPTIGQQAATNVILAVGMTFVILTGGIDLSVGSVLGLCGIAFGLACTGRLPTFAAVGMAVPAGVLAASWWSRRGPIVAATAGLLATAVMAALIARATAGGAPTALAVALCCLLGLGCGALCGLTVSVGRVPPFVVTLGMLTAARGLSVHATGGLSVSPMPAALRPVGTGWPVVAVALGCVLVGWVALRMTTAGRAMQAVGGNEEASRLSGLDLVRHKTIAYMVSGLCAALAAIVVCAKFNLADTNAGAGAELNAIAAVVIGGTPLSGGRGGVVGSLVGALTIAVLNAGLVLIHVQDTLQGVVIGLVIVLTVMIDQWRGRD